MIFKFRHEGKVYEFDDDRMGLTEARWIKRETGLVGMAFLTAFRELDPDALTAVFALALRRGGMVEIETLADVPLEEGNEYFDLVEKMREAVEEDPPAPAPNRQTRRATTKK